jgi:sugar/nucleoside kinase (ribokinase family)
MTPVVVVGELNVDLVFSGCPRLPAFGTEITALDCTMTLGSASAICAVGLARIGRPVTFVGKVGADPWGLFCVEALRAEGIDVSVVIRDPALKTGVTAVLTSSSDRALVTHPGATEALTAGDLPPGLFSGRGHLHASSFFLQKGMRSGWRAVLADARAAGWTTSLDPGFDPSESWIGLTDLLPLIDVLLPNEVELAGLSARRDPEEALRALSDGRTLVAAKLGARGAMALVDGRAVIVPPPPVVALDTTGAGDSFNAGFLDAWLEGCPVADCLRAGVTCGALSTRGLGGTTTQPTREELRSTLEAVW